MSDAGTVTDEMVDSLWRAITGATPVGAGDGNTYAVMPPTRDQLRREITDLLATQPQSQRIAELEHERTNALEKLEDEVVSHEATKVERDQALAREEQLREALTPSADTKAACSGEFRMGVRLRNPNSGEEDHRSLDVPWTTIKEVMAAIRDYAEQRTRG